MLSVKESLAATGGGGQLKEAWKICEKKERKDVPLIFIFVYFTRLPRDGARCSRFLTARAIFPRFGATHTIFYHFCPLINNVAGVKSENLYHVVLVLILKRKKVLTKREKANLFRRSEKNGIKFSESQIDKMLVLRPSFRCLIACFNLKKQNGENKRETY